MMGARAEPRRERAETLWAWPWLAATLRVWAIVALVLGAAVVIGLLAWQIWERIRSEFGGLGVGEV